MRALVLLILLALLLASVPAAAAYPSQVEVRVGQEVLVPVQGAVYVEAADPAVAEAELAAPGLARVRGNREGETILVVVTEDGAFSVPVRVLPSPARPAPAVVPSPMDSWLEIAYLPRIRTWQVVAWSRQFEGSASPAGWRVRWSGPELTVLASSNLQVLRLSVFGVPGGWGVEVRSREGWQIVAGRHGSGVRRFWRLDPGTEVGVSWTTLGPVVDVRIARSERHVVDLAFLLRDGLQAAGLAGVKLAEGTWVYYSISPSSQVVTLAYTRDRLSLALAADGRVVQAALGVQGLSLSGGVWWRSGQGWSAWLGRYLVLAGMPGWVRLEARQDGSVWVYGVFSGSSPSPQLVIPLGSGSSLAASGSPVPSLIRLRLVIPRERPQEEALEPAPASPAAPGGLLLVRACRDLDGDGKCGGARDEPLSLVVTVDERPVRAWEAVAVPAGRHAVAVPIEEVPEALAPASHLECEVEVEAGGVAVCDFTFSDP